MGSDLWTSASKAFPSGMRPMRNNARAFKTLKKQSTIYLSFFLFISLTTETMSAWKNSII